MKLKLCVVITALLMMFMGGVVMWRDAQPNSVPVVQQRRDTSPITRQGKVKTMNYIVAMVGGFPDQNVEGSVGEYTPNGAGKWSRITENPDIWNIETDGFTWEMYPYYGLTEFRESAFWVNSNYNGGVPPLDGWQTVPGKSVINVPTVTPASPNTMLKIKEIGGYTGGGSNTYNVAIPAGGVAVGSKLILCLSTRPYSNAYWNSMTVTDAKGNTWNLDKAQGSTDFQSSVVNVWSTTVTTALDEGDLITLGNCYAGTSMQIRVAEFTGVGNVHVSAGAHDGDGANDPNFPTATTDPTTEANVFVFAVGSIKNWMSGGALALTPSVGYTNNTPAHQTGGSGHLQPSYKVVSETGAQSATYTADQNGATKIVVVVAYSAAAPPAEPEDEICVNGTGEPNLEGTWTEAVVGGPTRQWRKNGTDQTLEYTNIMGGCWLMNDNTIVGPNRFYNVTADDFPPASGWLSCIDNSASPMTVTPGACAGGGGGGGDTTKPTFDSAEISESGEEIIIRLDKALSLPLTGDEGFVLGGVAGRSIGALLDTGDQSREFVYAINGGKVTSAENPTVAYQPGDIADSATPPNAMDAFAAQTVDNLSTYAPDATRPTVASASINTAGNIMTVVMAEADSPPVLPAAAVAGFVIGEVEGRGVGLGARVDALTFEFPLIGKVIYQTDDPTLEYDSTIGNVTDSASPPNTLLSFNSLVLSNASTVEETPAVVIGLPEPYLIGFTPDTAPAGATLKLIGEDLFDVARVTFNGIDADFTALSSSEITAIVPEGDVEGDVVVVTPGGAVGLPGFALSDPPIEFEPTPEVVDADTAVLATAKIKVDCVALTLQLEAVAKLRKEVEQILLSTNPAARDGLDVEPDFDYDAVMVTLKRYGNQETELREQLAAAIAEQAAVDAAISQGF